MIVVGEFANLRVTTHSNARQLRIQMQYEPGGAGYLDVIRTMEVVDHFLFPLVRSVRALCPECRSLATAVIKPQSARVRGNADSLQAGGGSSSNGDLQDGLCGVPLADCLGRLGQDKFKVRLPCGQIMRLDEAIPHLSVPWARSRLRRAEDFDLRDILACGLGTVVYKCTLDKTEVVVKRFRSGPVPPFLREAPPGTGEGVRDVMTTSRSPRAERSILPSFAREVVVQAMVDHPCCTRFLSMSFSLPALVVESLPHGTLFDYLHTRKPAAAEAPLSWPQRVRIALDIALACAYLHTIVPAVMHRDLKSPNVFLVQDPARAEAGGATPIAKVGDFGSYFWLNDWATGRLVDNPVWLAPEVIANQKYTLSSDVYSFGVIFFEILTGQQFYGNCAFMSTIEDKVLEGSRPLVLREHCVPRECLSLLHRFWAAFPDVRPDFVVVVTELGNILRDVMEVALDPVLEKMIADCQERHAVLHLDSSSGSSRTATSSKAGGESKRSRRVRHLADSDDSDGRQPSSPSSSGLGPERSSPHFADDDDEPRNLLQRAAFNRRSSTDAAGYAATRPRAQSGAAMAAEDTMGGGEPVFDGAASVGDRGRGLRPERSFAVESPSGVDGSSSPQKKERKDRREGKKKDKEGKEGKEGK